MYKEKKMIKLQVLIKKFKLKQKAIIIVLKES